MNHHVYAAHESEAAVVSDRPDPFKDEESTTCPVCEKDVVLKSFKSHLSVVHDIKCHPKVRITRLTEVVKQESMSGEEEDDDDDDMYVPDPEEESAARGKTVSHMHSGILERFIL